MRGSIRLIKNMPGNSIEAKQHMIKIQSSKVFFFTYVFLSARFYGISSANIVNMILY